MGRKRSERKIKEILAGDNWILVDERPAPGIEDISNAVAAHNANYITEGSQGSQGSQSVASHRDWQRNGQQRFGDRMGSRSGSDHSTTVIVPIATRPPDTDWTCPVADVKGCPIAAEPQVEMPLDMYRACTELADEFDTEWMAYLIGDLNQSTGRAAIREMYFPPQSASGAHVEMPDDQFRVRPGTIAAIHSHVQMGAFWSATDEAHANWPIEIVINAKGESKCRMRIKLECGRFSRADGKVILVGIRAADTYRDQLKEAIKPAANLAGYGEAAGSDHAAAVDAIYDSMSFDSYNGYHTGKGGS
jgi:hypothetical protein